MKPNGLSMRVSGAGGIMFAVSTPSRVEDAVWEAVELAIDSGWTPQQFKNEISDAWREKLNDEAKQAVDVLSR
jgi:hypothetical protein